MPVCVVVCVSVSVSVSLYMLVSVPVCVCCCCLRLWCAWTCVLFLPCLGLRLCSCVRMFICLRVCVRIVFQRFVCRSGCDLCFGVRVVLLVCLLVCSFVCLFFLFAHCIVLGLVWLCLFG